MNRTNLAVSGPGIQDTQQLRCGPERHVISFHGYYQTRCWERL